MSAPGLSRPGLLRAVSKAGPDCPLPGTACLWRCVRTEDLQEEADPLFAPARHLPTAGPELAAPDPAEPGRGSPATEAGPGAGRRFCRVPLRTGPSPGATSPRERASTPPPFRSPEGGSFRAGVSVTIFLFLYKTRSRVQPRHSPAQTHRTGPSNTIRRRVCGDAVPFPNDPKLTLLPRPDRLLKQNHVCPCGFGPPPGTPFDD